MAVFTRTINTQDSRMIQKLSTVSGQVPTVAPSDNHVDGTWDSLDVYIGELFMNSADGKLWSRTSNGIKEIFIVPSTVANGDTFYLNASGGITRLPIGTSGQVLTVSSGNVPSWSTSASITTISFKKTLSAANIITGGSYDISELPAPGVGYAWEILSCSGRVQGQTIAYDGSANVKIINSTGGAKEQWVDGTGGNFTSLGNIFCLFLQQSSNYDNVYENDKMQINLDQPSTVGNGTITVYGTARLITL